MSQLYVYKLIEPGLLAEHETAIKTHLFSASHAAPIDGSFRLSPVSGCIKYFDHGRLWKNSRPDRLPRSSREAREEATRFLRNVNQRFAAYRSTRKLKPTELPDLFPNRSLRHLATRLVFAAGSEQPDHWISTWLVHLRPGPEASHLKSGASRVPVFGALTEVRIGIGGQVVAATSSWRPWVHKLSTRAYPPPKADHDTDHGNNGPEDNDHARVFYLMEGTEEPQRFLSPYYGAAPASAVDSHETLIRPACRYSLIVEIQVTFEAEGVRFSAHVMEQGGEMVRVTNEGRWALSWLYSPVDATLGEETRRANADEITLREPGVHHVEALVEDRATGTVRTTYHQVPVGLDIEPQLSQGEA